MPTNATQHWGGPTCPQAEQRYSQDLRARGTVWGDQ